MYVSIIKELSSRYSIAIIPLELDERSTTRIKSTNKVFLDLCVSFGAQIIYDQKICVDIEILPQYKFNNEDIVKINDNIKSKKTFWLTGLAMGNALFSYLYGKKIDKILVVDRQFYNYRINQYESVDDYKFADGQIVEIGIPYSKYPVFPSFGIDYIWANPTPFSFSCTSDRLAYLENVFSLLKRINEKDVVALKPHNADERSDFVIDRRIYAVLSNIKMNSFHSSLDNISRTISMFLPAGCVNDFFVNISIVILYIKIMKRVVLFREITEYHNLNLELFLQNVHKGLITGRSNSIWHGLFLKKAVYNCIDEEKKYYSELKMHKYSMMYLNVHGNYHQLSFDQRLWNVVLDQTRNADLIGFLTEQLSEC